MTSLIKSLFTAMFSKKPTESNDFSDFFLRTKSKDKAKVIRRVLREATEEQKELMKKYESIKV